MKWIQWVKWFCLVKWNRISIIYYYAISWSKSTLMLLKKFQLTENRIGILIIIAVISIYHFIVFETEIINILSKYIQENFFLGMIIPGLFSAAVYAIFTKKIIKIIAVGLLAILVWYIWFMIYFSMTFTVI